MAEQRRLRRAALLSFPRVVLNEETLDRIVEEGFTDVGAGLVELPKGYHGFSLENGERLARMCAERGLGYIAFTGYMKYQETLLAKEPHRLMHLAGDGAVQDLDGLRVRWLCPFRPENKAWYLDQLMEVCRWPAVVEIHLNDEASLGFGDGTIGCYCDYCRSQFREATGREPPTSRDWEDPLWYAWLEARFDNWQAVHSELRAAVKEVRPDVAVGIQHSPVVPERNYNAWQTGIRLGRDAIAQDVIATDPYHYNHHHLILHRPHRRILSETTRSLVAACLDRQVDIYPQGFMPPSQAVPMGRQDGLLAAVVPFALGADMVMPYTYEQMKIIPGFFEAFDEARRLMPAFASHRPYAFAAMLMPQQSEIYGHHASAWGHGRLINMVDLLYRTGLPWGWFWDERLDDAGDRLRGPLILPETHCLTGQPDRAHRGSRRGRRGAAVDRQPARRPVGGKRSLPAAPPDPLRRLRDGAAGRSPADRRTGAPRHPRDAGGRPRAGGRGPRHGGGPAGAGPGGGGGPPGGLAGRHARGDLDREDPRQLDGRGDRQRGAAAAADPVGLGPPAPDAAGPLPAGGRLPQPEARGPARGAHHGAAPHDRGGLAAGHPLPLHAVGCRTSLVIEPPEGRSLGPVREIWTGEDWSSRVEAGADGTARIPLDIPGDCDLLALQVELRADR